MKKFVFIPEVKHRQIMTVDKRKMLKRYQLAQNILHDPEHLYDDVKMDKYNKIMHDFNEIMHDFSMPHNLKSTVRSLKTR